MVYCLVCVCISEKKNICNIILWFCIIGTVVVRFLPFPAYIFSLFLQAFYCSKYFSLL